MPELKTTIMRKFRIDAGHRLWEHDGKCRNIHGHSYEFWVHFCAPELDSIGRVIDFQEVKNKIGGWLEANWDHGMIVHGKDPLAQFLSQRYIKVVRSARSCLPDEDSIVEIVSPLYGDKFFILPYNPTAENLSKYLFMVSQQLMLGTGVDVVGVVCGETPNCEAQSILKEI